MRPKSALWVLLALTVAAGLVAGCGGAEHVAESKREGCAAMTAKAEHDSCVAELQRGRVRAARNKLIKTECELGSKTEQKACQQGYRGGLVAESEQEMESVCAEWFNSPDIKAPSACSLGFQQAQMAKRRREEAPAQRHSEPLKEVGTITVADGEGTAFSDHYEIGHLFYPNEGTPPTKVMDACNLQDQIVIEKSAFAYGAITVSYTEGSFPERLGLDAEGIVQGTDMVMEVVAYQLNGEWLCRQEELESTSYEIEPGETWDIPIWFIAEEALNNSEPRVSAEVKNGWHFKFIGPNLTGTWKYSGPGAGECAGYEELYLYNRSGNCGGG